MQRNRLGLTKLNILPIGFGCAPMSGHDYGQVNELDLIRAVRKALDLGFNFFDTADIYGFGRAETLLSKALGHDRNKVVLATKFGLRRNDKGNVVRDCSPKSIMKSLEESLCRLKVEAISLYQIHWPDPNSIIEDTITTLLACQKAGKIKHIGCSNFKCELLEKSQKAGRIESTQAAYNLVDRSIEKEIIKCCEKFNMSILTHSSLARGFLSGKYKDAAIFNGTDTRKNSKYFSNTYNMKKQKLMKTMAEIGLKYSKTMSQVAIRWILENPAITCAIVGFKNANQVNEIFGSLGWKLSIEDYKNLSDITKVFIT